MRYILININHGIGKTTRALRAVWLLAAIAFPAMSFVASADVCDHVNRAAAAMGAATIGVTTQVAMAAAPVTAVTHSSGSLILTGASGYLADTLGFAAAAWAVATAPATIVAAAGVVVTGVGVVATCHYLRD